MRFRNEYWFLSNMYPCDIRYEDTWYKSAETIFQMMKCSFETDKCRFKFLSGWDAKRIGRKVKLRSDWHEVKVNIMRGILKAKFDDPVLMYKLKEIKGEITEDNNWGDQYWGRCNGVGENMLGKLLMEIRLDEQISHRERFNTDNEVPF